MPKSVKSSLSQIGWCNNPTKLQLQSIADCLLENFSSKNHKTIVNKKLKHLDDIYKKEFY